MPQPSFGKNALVILSTESAGAVHTAIAEIERLGGRIVHVYPPRILIGEILADVEAQVRAVANVRSLHRGRVDLAEVEGLGDAAVRAVKGWNRSLAPSFRALKSGRSGEGKSWGAPGYAPEGPVQPPAHPSRVEGDPSRPFERPAPGDDTSAYLIGTVAVSVILVEGKAPSYTFTPRERDTITAEIQDGLGWLGTQEPKAAVSWLYEFHEVSLDMDPAQVADFVEDTWRDAAMAKLGYPASWAGLEQFVADRRTALGTKWSYAIFVTRFPLWHFAYAFKPRVVLHYDMDGWGTDDMDRVAAHETGHIFGAADEYAESKCSGHERFGYLQVENGNCELDATQPIPCIMSHNTWAMCEYTRGHLGWRDSNGDGVLDPLDATPTAKPWWLALLEALCRFLGLTPSR